MNYAIIKVSNGSFSIQTEWGNNLNGAKVEFHRVCQTLWNAPDVVTAMVMIADENLDAVEGYREFIHHEVSAPVAEETPEE
jgi:hypothetical protein